MHAPTAFPTREAGPESHSEAAADPGPLTVRFPIVCPPLTAHAMVHTPPPTAERRLSRSILSTAPPAESGVGLRVGDTFFGFHLVEELGQGAFARVFLAHQESLAGRPVALKVTLRPTREAERLARLQHTNVVPVYSVHNAPPVQVICMPYLGRRTIADLIRTFRDDHPSREQSGRRTSGTRAARTTDVVDSGSAPKSPPTHPATRSLPLSDNLPPLVGDPTAVLRVLGQLAAGLAHAHARGILHLDLKPANVLLPDTGEPMLLDFNLSFDTTTADRELVGGTVPYMATEQLIDLRTRGRGQIDARTDLYSLGVMAFEMLAGTVPFPASSKDLIDMDALIAARRGCPPSLRDLNPAVTPAVEAIIHKLLAPEPADRYQSADDLKTDIDRHLADRPLCFATEPSVVERLGKFRRRNPRLLGRLALTACFAAAVSLGALAYTNHEQIATAEAVARAQSAHESLDRTRLDLIIPNDESARRRGIAAAEKVLAVYGLPADSDWKSRPEVRRLSEAERVTLASDLGELLLLLAEARWHEAEPKTGDELTRGAADALRLNRAARFCFPADALPALVDRQATMLAFVAEQQIESAGAVMPDAKPQALFLDAAAAIAASKFSEARSLLEKVVREQPAHGVGQFCLAYCKEQLGQYESALERYQVAQSLLSNDARPAYQRGVILGRKGKHEEAEMEFSVSLRLDPDQMLAHRDRGFALFRTGESKLRDGKVKEAEISLRNAEADLTRALALGARPMQIYSYRHQVRQKLGDSTGALADQTAADGLTPQHEGDFVSRGMARLSANQFQEALDDFRAATQLNPRSFAALVNQSHVLADQLKDPADALKVMTRLTQFYPEYALGRSNRAVLLARLGKRTDAHAEVEQALRLTPKDSEIIYRAACVYSLTSVIEPADKTKALAYMQSAITNGYKRIKLIETDGDLDNIRNTPRFREITEAAASLFQ